MGRLGYYLFIEGGGRVRSQGIGVGVCLLITRDYGIDS